MRSFVPTGFRGGGEGGCEGICGLLAAVMFGEVVLLAGGEVSGEAGLDRGGRGGGPAAACRTLGLYTE